MAEMLSITSATFLIYLTCFVGVFLLIRVITYLVIGLSHGGWKLAQIFLRRERRKR